ncbi:cytochrome c oxidase subunit 2A [Aquibacillus halophilus]|uniref:Cytochrome c oxidase subunit 2A n=1 Tax=Aquibacillus halophilus TaxID=930132 RepID=A0A6A8DMI2_9BACI|nr:cytochrome c oxidase subunit 2A [Aquibacillus halophilus]MRH42452.1 cytochrome c oxidase subunit 2A [Aquibacillus halophilus]
MSNINPLQKENKQPASESEPELKGTLIAVFSIGAFIVVSWFIVFALFVAR